MPDRDPRLRLLLVLLATGALFVLAVAAGLLLGSTELDLGAALAGERPHAQILFVARLPRVLLAALTGGSLAAAGVAFQALLRNPLATPFTLGVSSGASLGAACAILLGLDVALLGAAAVPLFALAGALVAVLAVYAVALRRGPALQTNTLLLAGVCLAFFFGAVVLFLHYLADFGNSYRMMRWLMGSLDVTDPWVAGRALVPGAVGFGLLYATARRLNVLAGGDEVARSRGVRVRATQRTVYFAASLLTAAVVAAAGPIGFVGLVVPHILRLILGPDHRILMPAALLGGGAFLIVCDLLGRVLLAPTEIPVGVITAIIGGPFLIWLLTRHDR